MEDDGLKRYPFIKSKEEGEIEFSDEFQALIIDLEGNLAGCILSGERYSNIIFFDEKANEIPLTILDKEEGTLYKGKEPDVLGENQAEKAKKAILKLMEKYDIPLKILRKARGR